MCVLIIKQHQCILKSLERWMKAHICLALPVWSLLQQQKDDGGQMY